MKNSSHILLLSLALAAGAACNDPDLSGSGVTGPLGGGGSSGFGPSDLVGDWLAVLTPDNPLKDPMVAYWRINGDEILFEAANTIGTEWTLADSVTGFTVDSLGNLNVWMEQTGTLPDPDRMELLGALNESGTGCSGDYLLHENDELVSQGTFTAVRSSGPGHFTQDMLEGTWTGIGLKASGKSRDVILILGPDGTVLGGDMEDHVFIQGGVNTGIFTFSDTAVGRLDDVVMQSTDGSTQTLEFLLLDDQGTILSGPGFDSKFGSGHLFLEKQASEN